MHVLNFEFISNFTYKNVFVQVVVIMSTCVFCRVLQCHNLIRKAGFQWQSVGGHCCMRECACMYFNFHKIQSEYNKKYISYCHLHENSIKYAEPYCQVDLHMWYFQLIYRWTCSKLLQELWLPKMNAWACNPPYLITVDI